MKTLMSIFIIALGSNLAFGQTDSTELNKSTMTKYGLHGSLKAREGKVEELAKILIKASQLVSTAKGCQLYVVGLDDTQPNTVWITEIWETKEDHDKSLEVPGVRELIKTAMPLLDGQPEKGQELSILGGAGI